MKKLSYNLIGLFIFILVVYMSIGFALYKQDLGLNSNITLKKAGKLEITSAVIVTSECSNLANYTEPVIDGLNVTFKVTGSSNNFVATYLIDINNGSLYDYIYTDFAFNSSISTDTDKTAKIEAIITNNATNQEILPGEVLKSGESITLKVKINIETENANTEVDISGDVSSSQDNTGYILASLTPNSLDLRGENTIDCFKVSVANTFKYARVFNLYSSNENILLTDVNGNFVSTFNIGANETKEYDVCAKVADGSVFLNDTTTTIVVLKSNGIDNINVDELTISVDKDINASDKEIPEVGNVALSINESNTVVGEAVLTWDRIDEGGSPIVNYYILLYNNDTGDVTNYQTNSAVTTYNFSNLSAGNYYAKVYGEDEAGNIGSTYCDSATNENGYCSKSSVTLLKWEYTVTYNLSNLQHDDKTTTTEVAILNHSYETTLQLTNSNNYTLPSSVKITMGDVTLTSGTDYTYSSSSGIIVINKVTNDVRITASASSNCLIEGTKIMLADGSYKNIEDIRYDDLLDVWSYDSGSLVLEYPIWIEKKGTINTYQLTEFSDGTYLKTTGHHGIFNVDLNMFVSVDDKDNFKIGTKVAKVNDEGNLYTVTVKNIQIINEKVNYYHVVSTRYYNIIANDFITTDGTVLLSNLYGFGDNITWPSLRNTIINDKNNLYTYTDLNIMPYYMFKGLRAEEAKYLINYGLSKDLFTSYLSSNQLNEKMLMNPKQDKFGNRVWMVTTSDNLVTEFNKKNYLVKEGEYYILPSPIKNKNFLYWYNTGDGNNYYVGDKVQIWHGTYFKAIYKEK